MKHVLAIACLTMVFSYAPAFAQDYHGYPCTADCSGHEAGFEWAEDNDITDESDCGGNSNSFIEGCQAWVEEKESETSGDDE